MQPMIDATGDLADSDWEQIHELNDFCYFIKNRESFEETLKEVLYLTEITENRMPYFIEDVESDEYMENDISLIQNAINYVYASLNVMLHMLFPTDEFHGEDIVFLNTINAWKILYYCYEQLSLEITNSFAKGDYISMYF